jgi:hypothetical protein
METHRPDFYARSLQSYPYKVAIDNTKEWQQHWDIMRWCNEHFGNDNHCVTWRHALPGSPGRDHPLFSTWCFQNANDAVMFQMVWG